MMDRLMHATFVFPSSIDLMFEDGRSGIVHLADLGLDVRRMRPSSVRASSWGSAAEIEDVTGHTIHIDSAVLRARIDPAFAQVLRQAIAVPDRI